jgi:hypothetical protein
MKKQVSRRNFLKTTAAGAAGLAIGAPSIGVAKTSATGGAWTDGMQVHPTINNLRVVCAHDARLANVNAWVDDPVINELMDKMAIALAQKPTAAEAWATIFRKPASKTWAQTKAAFKCEDGGLAWTMIKMAGELNKLGVPYSNMYMFDSNTSGSSRVGSSTPPSNMPAGMNWSGPATSGLPNDNQTHHTGVPDLLHGLMQTNVPIPNGTTMQLVPFYCTTDIANGTIDILVTPDVASHDHGAEFGGANLTCKSMYGVFDGISNIAWTHASGNGAPPHDGLTAVLAMEKSQAFLRNNNPPCMQLAFMNAIGGGVNRIFMGVFPPIVDYLTYTRIRQPLMGKPSNPVWPRFYKDFGYTDAQVAGLDFIDALTYVYTPVGTVRHAEVDKSSNLSIIVSNSTFRMSKAEFSLPSRALSVSVKIYDQRGAVVREFSPSWERSMMLSWDGHNQSGNRLPAGVYAVRVSNGMNHAASEIALMPR